MVVGFPNVTRVSHDLESGVVSNVCHPPPPLRAPQTRESWDIMGDPEDCWGISESTRVVQPTMANVFLKHARLNVYVLLSSSLRVNLTDVDYDTVWVLPHTTVP